MGTRAVPKGKKNNLASAGGLKRPGGKDKKNHGSIGKKSPKPKG
jgi:hypothetical protein